MRGFFAARVWEGMNGIPAKPKKERRFMPRFYRGSMPVNGEVIRLIVSYNTNRNPRFW